MKRILVAIVLILALAVASFAAGAAVTAYRNDVKSLTVDENAVEFDAKKEQLNLLEYNGELYVSQKVLKHLGYRAEYTADKKHVNIPRIAAVKGESGLNISVDGEVLKFGDKQKPLVYMGNVYIPVDVLAARLSALGSKLEFDKKSADNNPKAAEQSEAVITKQSKLILDGKELTLNVELLQFGKELYIPLEAFAVQSNFKYQRSSQNLIELTKATAQKEEKKETETQKPIKEEKPVDKGILDEKAADEIAREAEKLLKETPRSKKEMRALLLSGNKSNHEYNTTYIFWYKYINGKNISIATADAALERISLDWNEVALQKANILMKYSSFSKMELILSLVSDYTFTLEEGKYAAEKIVIDWKQIAYERAVALESQLKCSKGNLEHILIKAKFTPEEVSHAMQHIQANWKANALYTARKFLKFGLPRDRVYIELTNKDVMFTPEEASYAVENLNK